MLVAEMLVFLLFSLEEGFYFLDAHVEFLKIFLILVELISNRLVFVLFPHFDEAEQSVKGVSDKALRSYIKIRLLYF